MVSILRPARSASTSIAAAARWVCAAPARAGQAAARAVIVAAVAVFGLPAVVPWRSVGRQVTEKTGGVMIAAAGWLVAPALGLLVGGLALVLAANAENVGTLIGLRLAAAARGDDE